LTIIVIELQAIMINLTLPATSNTPLIDFNKDDHILLFKGESRPENTAKFYAPLVDWLDEYYKWIYFLTNESATVNFDININFQLDYFNSTSAKFILDVFSKLSKLKDFESLKLTINWHYFEMDEDMLENGEDFESISGLDFVFHKS